MIMAYSMLIKPNLKHLPPIKKILSCSLSNEKFYSCNYNKKQKNTEQTEFSLFKSDESKCDSPINTAFEEVLKDEKLLKESKNIITPTTLLIPIHSKQIESSYAQNKLAEECENVSSSHLSYSKYNFIEHQAILLQNWISIASGLSKFRLTSFVVMSALAGSALAAPTEFASQVFLSSVPSSLIMLTLGTGLTSASANTINQILEIPHDSQMKRTRFRVLVKKQITVNEAVIFAITSGLSGLSMLYWGLNPLVASLGAFNLFLYTCVYTPMKRITQWNTWIGAFVGAIPPLMGWAAVTGHLEAGSLMLAALLYCWQLPHFMALSWNARDDYAKAGYVMSSVVDPRRCRVAALRHSIGTLIVCLAGAGCSAATLGPWAGFSLGVSSLPVNAAFIWYAYKFYRAPDDNTSFAARQLFKVSLLHLPLVMTAMLICTNFGNSIS